MTTQSKRLQQLQARGDALSVHFELGLRCYDAGDTRGVQRHRAAIGLLPEGGPGAAQFLALRWREEWLGSDRELALEIATRAFERHPQDPDAALELGDILNDMERREDALEVLLAGAEHHEDDPDIWYEVALAAEAIGQTDVRRRAFHRVWDLEREREPPRRLYVSEDEFVAMADASLERLPPQVREALGNVVILVDDYPDQWILETELSDPRILGLFDGPERAMEGTYDCVADGPSRVWLFRWNIERVCRSAEELAEQVDITVRHEIGHYLGLDEEALHYLGLG